MHKPTAETLVATAAVRVLQHDGALITLPPLQTIPTTAEFYDYDAKRNLEGHRYLCPAMVPATVALAAEYGYTIVPVGGGGLAAGTAVAAKEINRRITVIGVEPRTGADTAASLRAGHRVTLPAVPDTIADGLRHTSPARLPWEVNKVLLDDVATVTDDEIAQAMRWAFDHLEIVVEPSDAVALAGTGLPPGPAGVIISGGSVDYRTFRTITVGLPDALDLTVA
jgi:threonine dehydratase